MSLMMPFSLRSVSYTHLLHGAGEVVVHGLDHGGVELLGAQAVAAADDLNIGLAVLIERGAYILVEGLAQGAGLLGAVEHGDLLAGGGNGLQQALGAEGTVEVHLDQAQLLALLAVSYTHLGAHWRRPRSGPRAGSFRRAGCPASSARGIRRGVPPAPVSYTHLDVYKRQGFFSFAS